MYRNGDLFLVRVSTSISVLDVDTIAFPAEKEEEEEEVVGPPALAFRVRQVLRRLPLILPRQQEERGEMETKL